MNLPSAFLVPLISPYTDDTTSVSEVRMAKLVRAYREMGAAGFVVGSSIAEWSALALSERKESVEWTMRECAGLPVVVNASAHTTSAMVDLCQHGARHGARAAVVSLPPTMHLNAVESRNLVNVVRRHGQIPVSFLDLPEGTIKAVPEIEVEKQYAKSLGQHGLEGFQLSRGSSTCEFVCADGMCTPLAVLGPMRAQVILGAWQTTGHVAQGLWRLAGPIRFGKAATEMMGLESGPPRGPYLPLDDTGRGIMRRLLDLN